jgi:phospholipid transport system transporter-binding protein
MIKITEHSWVIESDMTIMTTEQLSRSYSGYLTEISNTWIIDLYNCAMIDTAGIALLLEYIRYSRSNNIHLELRGLSTSTLLLAKVHGAKDILLTHIK